MSNIIGIIGAIFKKKHKTYTYENYIVDAHIQLREAVQSKIIDLG